MQGKVMAVCTSPEKGTGKTPRDSIRLLPDYGIEGDAHAGKWHRQVSLLSYEEIEKFREKGADIAFGAFGENVVLSGIDLKTLPVGTRLRIEECLLEVSQIGKACHSHCAIFKTMGDCIMPREGIFAVVLEGGEIRPGMVAQMIPAAPDRPFRAAVITLSDRAAAGSYEDRSGPLLREMLSAANYRVEETLLLPDGKEKLAQELRRLADQRQIDLILTTGGTGFSERDQTPEATKAACEREVPGIGEALRAYSLQFTRNAILSRQTAGIRGKSLIINLPGSPKACREDLEFLLPVLPHGLGILRGTATD